MNQFLARGRIAMVSAFLILTGLILLAKPFLLTKGIDHKVLIGANALLFLVSYVCLLITKGSLTNANPHVFVRAVYTGFIIKFFVVALAALAYFKMADSINKPAVFISLVFYIFYNALEVGTLHGLMRQQKNG